MSDDLRERWQAMKAKFAFHMLSEDACDREVLAFIRFERDDAYRRGQEDMRLWVADAACQQCEEVILRESIKGTER